MVRNLLTALAFGAALLCSAGCGKKDAPKGGGEGGDDHDHGPGPHGGVILELGKFHGEFKPDHAKKEATVWILDGKAEKSAREGFPIFCAERLQAVKWRNWKMHFMRQDTMFDPPVKNPVPTIHNLYTDPREEKPTADTWVVAPILKIVGAYEESVKAHPLIPMGTPDPFMQIR